MFFIPSIMSLLTKNTKNTKKIENKLDNNMVCNKRHINGKYIYYSPCRYFDIDLYV